MSLRPLPPRELAARIDMALLKDIRPDKIREAVEKAERLGLRGISTYYTALDILSTLSKRVKKIIVIDFPAGASHIESKVKAEEQAIAHGADEVEFVVNVWKWLQGDRNYVINEIRALARIARATGVTSKALIETSVLTLDELRELLTLIASLDEEDKPHYVKMNTGWFSRGVRPVEVALASKIVKSSGIRVKAAGGIRDAYTASLLVSLGADVIGASNPEAIIRDAEEANKLS